MRCTNCGNDLPPGVRFCPKCGTPSAPTTAPVAPAQPTASFNAPSVPHQPLSGIGTAQAQKKSGCGKALLVLSILGALIIGVVGFGVYYGYYALSDKLKSSEAYTVAVSTLKQNPAVAEKMGAITGTGFPMGTFKEDGDGSGVAAYRMSVTGTKASGTYDVAMSRRAGKWYLTTGRVTLSGGETINLRGPNANTTDGAPEATDGDADAPLPPPVPGRAGAASGGALDGKAVSKPEPAYPPIAKAAKAAGAVVVQVVVDENGRVTSARAVSGHPLLRQSAEAAARGATFKPNISSIVSGRPAKTTGTLTYNFVAQ